MRGKEAFAADRNAAPRITPAHAGKRPQDEVGLPPKEDHPRTCGEKYPGQWELDWREGSPPHMRGKAALALVALVVMGITPAHAGKSGCWKVFRDNYRDHPRTCGEKDSFADLVLALGGSPPHMRGKDFRCLRCCVSLGITPAHAGKRIPQPGRDTLNEDHPRTCGEKRSGSLLMG